MTVTIPPSPPSFLEFHTPIPCDYEHKRLTAVQKQRAMALCFLDVLNTMDFALLDEMVTKDFKYMLSPASISTKLGAAIRDKHQMIETMKGIRHLVSELNLKAYEVVVGDKGTVVMHAKSDGKALSGTSYVCEYVYTLRFDTSDCDGLRIASVTEFVDSLQMTYMLSSETDAMRDRVVEGQV